MAQLRQLTLHESLLPPWPASVECGPHTDGASCISIKVGRAMCPHCSVAAIPGLAIPSTEVGPRVGMYGEAKVHCPKWDNRVVGS